MPHQYADDSQIYGSCRTSNSDELQSRLSSCIDDVACWMRSNGLRLNTSKTEIIGLASSLASSRRQHQLPPSPVKIGADYIVPAIAVRDLGIQLIVTSPCARMSSRHWPVAIVHCVVYGLFVDQCKPKRFNSLWHRSSLRGCTMVMPP
jgi:hypothetical protein